MKVHLCLTNDSNWSAGEWAAKRGGKRGAMSEKNKATATEKYKSLVGAYNIPYSKGKFYGRVFKIMYVGWSMENPDHYIFSQNELPPADAKIIIQRVVEAFIVTGKKLSSKQSRTEIIEI